jgi:hypothetical protein
MTEAEQYLMVKNIGKPCARKLQPRFFKKLKGEQNCMRVLFIAVIMSITSLASASDKHLTEDIISGTALKKLTNKGYMYLLLKTSDGNIWIESTDTKIVIGK